ncbi:hypothetical protein N018_10295 [Pseudomonas syringae CC1557]|uniref:Uncharacterized protein n=1 Tax=Pseudomonas syringae CC1557 TaxID=1357279 RepID=W0MYP1_PSESX|nr:hypothetical protein N018_10295 [Pseudomonas syringae CC1557]
MLLLISDKLMPITVKRIKEKQRQADLHLVDHR